MEIKFLIYLIGAIVYFIYNQYRKLQKEAINRKSELENVEMSTLQTIVVESAKKGPRVKEERQLIEKENSIKRMQSKMVKEKVAKPFFEKPEYVTSVFEHNYSADVIFVNQNYNDVKANVNTTVRVQEEIDFRKIILYNELINHPAWLK